MAINANYAATPRNACVFLTTANTDRSGTTAPVTLMTGGTAGSRIDDIIITATGTTTAGAIRFFLYNGTSSFLIEEVSVTAITPSATTPPFSITLTNLGWLLQNSTYVLKAATQNTETFAVCVTRGGDF